MERVGLPSPSMVVGLVVGIAYAVRSSVRLKPSVGVGTAAQAISGVSVGTYVSAGTLRGLGNNWLPVVVILVATLLLTLAAGMLLARIADVSPATAAFGMIAGGAAGIVAIADDLGADNRMVAVMQYLRVLLILLLTPIVAGALFAPGAGDAAGAHGGGGASYLDGLLLLAIAAPVGLWLARITRMTAPNFFGPMAVSVALALAGVSFAGKMPNLLPYVAFGVIGAQVGLDFTVATLRQARSILPAVLGLILLMLVACALLGLAMAPLAHVSRLDGYLATTPGVLQVVLATAIGMKANTTFVLSAQVLRLMMMLLAAPAVARRLVPMDRALAAVVTPTPTPPEQPGVTP
jgi:membrane AbrB-like protein